MKFSASTEHVSTFAAVRYGVAFDRLVLDRGGLVLALRRDDIRDTTIEWGDIGGQSCARLTLVTPTGKHKVLLVESELQQVMRFLGV